MAWHEIPEEARCKSRIYSRMKINNVYHNFTLQQKLQKSKRFNNIIKYSLWWRKFIKNLTNNGYDLYKPEYERLIDWQDKDVRGFVKD